MKETGMLIKDTKKYTGLRQLEEPPVEELMQLLHRKKIQEQLSIYKKNLAILDKKISIYRKEIKTT
ncbi:putative uncharacterized protein [Tetragenococcus halophilus subsp. halophilus]|uniref:Uncharacterized protein n=2 Tax=Tetragenococcus halophilus TaxID=51669 RepID=A0AAN1VRM0_TETHN|nr:hypothetical protein [Tetragenococcus halophilus]RQD32520.1 hypothetical protein C7K42_00750 [Tetragenococcus halophilus subsp. halophilus DSM 20339]BAK94441.1 hypothetical protein TEH_11140 [Tetragenococcus halophilus NBRC 12172]NRR75166.1 hypothetical protein [Tetragenococcus halophilus]GBD59235.1 putative uncharacterized protein [Tetragenococcus halophilus subsp. halophilus]GBD60563.1 putative uncharacterized protein [Tetragenococcus halophilus subsp. halophilus]